MCWTLCKCAIMIISDNVWALHHLPAAASAESKMFLVLLLRLKPEECPSLGVWRKLYS